MKNKVCTIIGAGPGVSIAVAKRFASEGYAVVLMSRNIIKLAPLVNELRDSGYRAVGYEADASNFSSVTEAYTLGVREFGNSGVLVYNAAVLRQGTPSRLNPEEFAADQRVNIAGALHAAQLALPGMEQAGEGTILLTGGGLALEPYPQYASLAAGKAGIRNLAFSLAAELTPKGIHCATVTICGFVKEGTKFAPALIAEKFWALHTQERGKWDREIIFQ